MESMVGLMGRDGDQFPVGMQVLAVDGDPVCLKVLEGLLRRCQYHVTTTNQAATALRLLRENKDMFHLVISDVHMPDMDGFKLLELVRPEMDLPVIMLSENGETKSVLRGVAHGANDYLLKPVRIQELSNVWQHVVRRKFRPREPNSLDLCEEISKPPSAKNTGDAAARKKPRARGVWSEELHHKFLAAVNQLGIVNAVPKEVLNLMNVQELTRRDVEDHLRNYRALLRRRSAVASQQASTAAASGDRDPFLHMRAFEGLHSYQPSIFESFNPQGLLSGDGATAFGLQDLASPKAIQRAGSNGAASDCGGDTNRFHIVSLQDKQQADLTQGLTAYLGQPQLKQKWMHQETSDPCSAFAGDGLPYTMSGTLQRVAGSSLPPGDLLECTQHINVGAHPSIGMPTASSGLLEGPVGVSGNLRGSGISQQGAPPVSDGVSAGKLPLHIPFDSDGATKLDAGFVVSGEQDQRLSNGGFNYDDGGAIVPEQTDVYDLEIPELQGGFNSDSCNFDDFLNSIINVENDEVSFMENDLGCELFPLGDGI